MSYLGWNTAATRDAPRVNGGGAETIVSDSDFRSGYAWQINAATDRIEVPLSATTSAITLNTNDRISVRAFVKVVTVGSTTPQRCLFIDGNGSSSFEVSWDNTDTSKTFGVQFIISGGSYQAQLHVKDANANASSGTPQTLTTGTKYELEWSLTIDSSTQITMRLYLDGALVDTLVHTAAGGTGTMQYFTTYCGLGVVAKVEAVEMRWDEIAVKLESSSYTTITADAPQQQLLLPNGDTGAVNWLTDAGATGTYTQWDDAFGSLSATDYNHSGTDSSAAKTEASTLQDGSFGSSDVIYGVSLGANGNQQGGDFGGGVEQLALDDGTESVASMNVACSSTKTFIAVWTAPPSGGSWASSAIAGLIGKCRRKTGSTNDWQVYAFWMNVLYKPVAAVAFAPNAAALVGSGVGIV